MKQFLVCSFILFYLNTAFAQKACNGFVYDAATGEALIGVMVYSADKKTGTSTDAYGHFTIFVNPNDELCFQYLGYEINCIALENKEEVLKVNLKAQTQQLKQAEVKGDRILVNKIGTHTIDLKFLNQLPVLGGEKDLIKSFQLMPGVKKEQMVLQPC